LTKYALLEKIIERWPVKVLSVVAALIIYAFYNVSQMQDRLITEPLVVEGSVNLMPSQNYPRTVLVRLRGSPNEIQPVLAEDIEVYVDISGAAGPGPYKAPVQYRKKGSALASEVLDITTEPAEIRFELDARERKFVPVTPDVQGETSAGYEQTVESLNPPRMRIDGPQSIVKEINSLVTDRIDMEGRSSDFTETTHVISPSGFVTVFGDGLVEYKCEIRPVLAAVTFDSVPVTAINLREGLNAEFDPPYITLKLQGPKNEIKRTSPPENAAGIDLSATEESGDYLFKISGSGLPPGWKLMESENLPDITAHVGNRETTNRGLD
jgi:hypothetical protein